MSQAPEVFGMDDNVDISKELQETKTLFDSILLTQTQRGGGGSGKKTEDTLNDIASDILTKVLTMCLAIYIRRKTYSISKYSLIIGIEKISLI